MHLVVKMSRHFCTLGNISSNVLIKNILFDKSDFQVQPWNCTCMLSLTVTQFCFTVSQ